LSRGPEKIRRIYYVYILANKRNGTLYTGVTNDLVRRVAEHKSGKAGGFTRTHAVRMLVHTEEYRDIRDAIAREKSIKRWRRAWKLELIEKDNPHWRNLYGDLNQ